MQARQIVRRTGLPQLQVVRAIAASLVVFHHFGQVVEQYRYRPSWIVDTGLANLCACGVDLFFVLSGFLMVYTTAGISGKDAAFGFLRKRLIRILPLYWFWTTVLLLLWGLGLARRASRYNAVYIAGSYLLLPIFSGTYPLLRQGWTLSFELLFYGLFALAIGLALRGSKLVFLVAAFLVFMVIGKSQALSGPVANFFSDPIVFEFAYGAAAAMLLSRISLVHPRLRSVWFTRPMIVGGVACLLATLMSKPAESWRFLIWGLPALLIVLGCALGKQSATGSVYRMLVYLGDASYSIYLSHEFFALFYGTALKGSNFLQRTSPDFTIIFLGLVTVAVTSLGYPLLERPLQRWVNGFRFGRKA